MVGIELRRASCRWIPVEIPVCLAAIHGDTDKRDYWNFGRVDGLKYSNARHAAARDFPTFDLDKTGPRNSSQPAPKSTPGRMGEGFTDVPPVAFF
jgi:hypothetical protein